MTLPPLPEQPRAFLCTKCGHNKCEGDIKQKYPVCANCGYLGFADDIGHTLAQMQDYGQQCAHAALARALAIIKDSRENTRYDAIQAIKELMK